MQRMPFRARADGAIEVRLEPAEASAVRQIATELLAAVDAEREEHRRLYPAAYPDDPARETEFRELTRDELMERKRAAARAVAGSIEEGVDRKGALRSTLDPDAADAWLGVLNDARLVLGTRLDVTEEREHDLLPPEHPDAPAWNLYLYLGWLEETLIDALAARDFA